MTNLGVATAMINAARELTARAEAAEARVAELSKRGTRVGEKELGERCDRLERERDEARAKLAAADRLAEAARAAIRALDYGDEETKLKEALAAYEAGEPVVHPDTAALEASVRWHLYIHEGAEDPPDWLVRNGMDACRARAQIAAREAESDG